MINDIEACMLKLEQCLRGGGAQIQSTLMVELNSQATQFLSWFSSGKAVEQYESYNAANKAEMLALAVKLHNKARNLTSSAYSDVRTKLKATAAWMLSLYGGDKSKVFSVVVSILSKAGEELTRSESSAELALRCLSGSILHWHRATSLSLHKALSPVELQDMKLAVFWASLEKANLLFHHGASSEEVKKAISGAAEIMVTLPPKAKLAFSERVIVLGREMSQTSVMLEDTIHCFKLALNAVDSALLPQICSEDYPDSAVDKESSAVNPADVQKLRMNIQLSLTFLYMQANDFSKALGCVSVLEDSAAKSGEGVEQVAHTIQYAKYMIFLKDADRAATESALWKLLQLPLTPFSVSLAAVKALENEGGKLDIATTPYFKHLAGKYPNEPEYTQIRLSHVQSILADGKESSGEDSSSSTSKALEICNSIISAHTRRDKVLTGEHYQTLRCLLVERVRWLRSLNNWNAVLDWCDALLALLSENMDEHTDCASVYVVKCDALIHLKRYSEAREVSLAALRLVHNTRTILIHFKAIIHADNKEEAGVQVLRDLHSFDARSDSPASSAEYLTRVILCCHLARGSDQLNKEHRDRVAQLLLKEWIKYYTESQAWHNALLDTGSGHAAGDLAQPNNDESTEPTYFGVVCDCLHLFFLYRMKHVLSPSTADSSETVPVASLNGSFKSKEVPSTPQTTPSAGISAPVNFVSHDLFVSYGYPDSLSHMNTHPEGFHFNYTLSELRAEVTELLDAILQTMAAVEKDKLPLTALGKTEDLSWLAELAHNLATLLVKNNGSTNNSGHDDSGRMLTAARLFELAELLTEKLHSFKSSSSLEASCDSALCLLIACSCRIDAEVSAQEASAVTTSSPTFPNTPTLPSNNLIQARLNVQKADRLLLPGSDFDDSRTQTMRSIALLLEFDVVCKLGDSRQVALFLEERQVSLLRLQPCELRRCALLAKHTPNVSGDIVRGLLNLTLQRLMREGTPDYTLMGGVYRELIEMAPTRRQALEKVEEFEQLATGMQNSTDEMEGFVEGSTTATRELTAFLTEDVDHIVSLAYNYGVTLMDLDQNTLAEKFVFRAMNLLPCASDAVRGWLPRIQDTYTQVLKVKEAAVKGPAGAALLHMVNISAQDPANADVTVEAKLQKDGGGNGEIGDKKRSAAAAGLAAAPPRDAPIHLDQVQ